MLSSRMQILRKLCDLNIPAFTGEFVWLVNGERGHLHTATACRKLRLDKHFARKITLPAALDRHVICEKCVGHMALSDAQRAAMNDAEDLDRIESYLESADKHLTENSNTLPLLHAWRKIRMYNEAGQHLMYSNCGEHFLLWHQRLEERLAVAEDLMPEDAAIDAEILRWAAIQTLRASITRRQPLVENDGLDITGASLLADTWINLLETGVSVNTATETIMADRNTLTQVVRTKMPDCDELKRNTVRNRLTVWAEQYDAFLAPQPPVMLCVGDITRRRLTRLTESTNICDIILSDLSWTIVPIDTTLSRGALICHPTIGDYIYTERGMLDGHMLWKPITLDVSVTNEDIEAMLRLWEPTDPQSVYRQPSDAWAAAKRL